MTRVVRQDAKFVHGLLTPFAMPVIQRQLFGGCHMKPVQNTFGPCAPFIHMLHSASQQQLFEDEHGQSQRVGRVLEPIRQRSLEKVSAKNRSTHSFWIRSISSN